jgi:hypothetical protein
MKVQKAAYMERDVLVVETMDAWIARKFLDHGWRRPLCLEDVLRSG